MPRRGSKIVLAVAVPDPAAAVRFYDEALGAVPDPKRSRGAVELVLGSVILRVVPVLLGRGAARPEAPASRVPR